jgi:hypothetical protein
LEESGQLFGGVQGLGSQLTEELVFAEEALFELHVGLMELAECNSELFLFTGRLAEGLVEEHLDFLHQLLGGFKGHPLLFFLLFALPQLLLALTEIPLLPFQSLLKQFVLLFSSLQSGNHYFVKALHFDHLIFEFSQGEDVHAMAIFLFLQLSSQPQHFKLTML